MLTIDQQIEEIEEVLRKTPHHKATNGFIGQMRAKIARLRDKEIESNGKSGGSGGSGFTVRKQGDATVVLVGPPSAGKSTLLNQLTNAESKVAPYAFTTVTVVPGMLKYNQAYIQILDIPGLIEGAKEGKGRGKEVLSVARGADLLLIMTDVKRVGAFAHMVKELTGAGIRINQKAPQVLIEKKVSGGLEIHSNIQQSIDKETIKEIAREFGIKSGDITLKEKLTMDRLFDAFSPNRVYVPAIFVINKIDEMPNYKDTIDGEFVGISADKKVGVDDLINQIWKALKFVTVYILDDSIIMKEGETLKDVALKIGTDFSQKVKFAKINGNGAKFEDQEVSLLTEVKEGMRIEFV
ncbi:MAG TPA: GTPase [Alphaproteobacteria bacterium]|jgi:ribosome-interacting GTPase 1|nr:GTPase [Alphaproteobacteria bacterium]